MKQLIDKLWDMKDRGIPHRVHGDTLTFWAWQPHKRNGQWRVWKAVMLHGNPSYRTLNRYFTKLGLVRT